MSLSKEKAISKSYMWESGACSAVKSVSTDHISPARPVCPEYQWCNSAQAHQWVWKCHHDWLQSHTYWTYWCASLKTASLKTQLSEGLFIQPKTMLPILFFFFFLITMTFGIWQMGFPWFFGVFFWLVGLGFTLFFPLLLTINTEVFLHLERTRSKSYSNSQTLLLTFR